MRNIGIACAVTLVLTASLTALAITAVEGGARLEAQNIARSIAYSVATQPESVQSFLDGFDRLHRRDIVVVDLAERIVADSAGRRTGDASAFDPPHEVALTLADGESRAFVERSPATGTLSRRVTVPVYQDGKPGRAITGAVVLEYSDVHEHLLKTCLWQILCVAGGGLLSTFAMALAGMKLARSGRRTGRAGMSI